MSKYSDEKRERYYQRQVMKAIGLDKVPTAAGAEKKCYIFSGFVVFKQDVGFSDIEALYSAVERKMVKFQNTQYLANCGINTPRIVDIMYEDGCLFEIQERAPGQVIAYTNETNILNSFSDGKNIYVSIKDMSDSLKSDFCKQVLDYNFQMQKKLKDAPILHFVKFVKDFKAIEEYGLDLDIHGENFLYDTEKGFYFIDLPVMQSTPKTRYSIDKLNTFENMFDNRPVKKMVKYREVSDYRVVQEICNLIVDFLKYSSYVYDVELIKLMKKNNLSIIKNKIFPAVKKAGFKLTDEEWAKLQQSLKKYSNKKVKNAEKGIKTI